MPKELKEKIIEILENRVYGWREGVFTPRFFELSADLILELIAQQKQKWVEEIENCYGSGSVDSDYDDGLKTAIEIIKKVGQK